MGLYLSAFVGPYIKLKNKKDESTETIHVCDNDVCRTYGEEFNTKHCPNCGDPIVCKKVPTTTFFGYYDWINDGNEEYEDTFRRVRNEDLLEEDEEILLSNRSSEDSYGGDMQYGGIVDVSEVNVQKDIEKFRNKYKEIVTGLETFFGKENVKLCWGTAIWYS